MYKLARVLLVVGAVLVVRPTAAHAEEPILDGHRFVPSSLVVWSFIDTEVASTSEAGITEFVVQPEVPLLAPLVVVPRRVDGSFIAAAQTTSASIGFGRVVSVNLQLSASGILPRDTASSLVAGGHAALGGRIGFSLGLVRGGPLQVTLRADFSDQEVESIIPDNLPSSPRVSGHIRGIRPALAAALTLSPAFGLQGSFTADWERFDVATTDDVTTVAGALAATFSLEPVPLTLLVGANALHEFGRDVSTLTAQAVFGADRTDYNVEGGVYLTVRRELDLGLLYQAEVAAGDHNHRHHGVFRLGYYF